MKRFTIILLLLAVSASSAEACRFRRRCCRQPVAAKTAEAPMAKVKLGDVYAEVSRRADTAGTKINAAETSRVLAKFFDVLSEYKPAQAVQIVADGLKAAQRRKAKKDD